MEMAEARKEQPKEGEKRKSDLKNSLLKKIEDTGATEEPPRYNINFSI
jgi:hypothetical protein